MARKTRRFYLMLVVAIAVIVIVGTNIVSTNDAISKVTLDLAADTLKGKPSNSYQHTRKHDFSYDRETWDKNRPRIAILAGPHKTASTTLQQFFVELAGLTVPVKNTTQEATSSKFQTPMYPNTEWVWPIGVKSEYEDEFRTMRNRKFYASMTSLLSGRRQMFFFPAWKVQTKDEKVKSRERVTDYWRELFKRPWEDGKKILIAAESFDSLVMGLTEYSTAIGNRGEEMHVSPDSSDMIDALLGLFPWDEPNTTRSEDANDNSQKRPLRLEDIEIHINYRTPRIDHVVSIWHQLGMKKSLKSFVENMGKSGRSKEASFYQLNSLALALQFVRKGIKTTIVDMKGVFEKEAKDSTTATNKNDVEKSTNETIVGGLQGVVACDILKMGIGSTSDAAAAAAPGIFCDDESKLHLSNYDAAVKNKNQKHDNGHNRKVTVKQMEEVNQVFEEYDCGLWKHLKKYQEQGLLRILYPSEHLFEACNSEERNLDVSFLETLKKAKDIVSSNEDASNSANERIR